MISDSLNGIFGIINTLANGDTESKLNLLNSFSEKRKKRELETEMYMEFVSKAKKAKWRGRKRVEQNYITACRKLGNIPWGFMTKEEKERMEYENDFYY